MVGDLLHFSERLRAERKRLGYSQMEVIRSAAITKNTQVRYEQGEGNPGIDYLQAIDRIGLDSHYIITGQRGAKLTEQHQELLRLWEAAPALVRQAALAVLRVQADNELGVDQ